MVASRYIRMVYPTQPEKNNQQYQNINSNASIETVTLSVTKRTDAHEHLPPEATRRTITTTSNKPRHWARAGPETCANRMGSLLSSPAPCMQAQGAQSPLTLPGNKLIFSETQNHWGWSRVLFASFHASFCCASTPRSLPQGVQELAISSRVFLN